MLSDANYEKLQDIFHELAVKVKNELDIDLFILWGGIEHPKGDPDYFNRPVSPNEEEDEHIVEVGYIEPQISPEMKSILLSNMLSGYYVNDFLDREDAEEEWQRQPWR